MKRIVIRILLAIVVPCFYVSVYGADTAKKENTTNLISKEHSFKPQQYSSQSDMAFISVWGSKPSSKKLQGFQRAVLFNARGEVVKKVDMRSDSVYSLDRMIQENKTKGPLFIRMYR